MPGSALCQLVCGPEPPNNNSSDDRHLTAEDIPNLKGEHRRQVPQEDETSLKTAE